MELEPGYKHSELGVIPADWDVCSVRDVADVKGGKRLPAGKTLTSTPTAHPYIRVTDMRPGGVHTEDIRYVSDDAFPAIRNYRIWADDLFVSVAGTLGIVGRVPPELDGANLTENADRLTNLRCDRDLLLYHLQSERIQADIDVVRTVGAQPKLALSRIQRFHLALPKSRDEQRAISATLADVDALLASVSRLAEKKRDLKQAVMQRLLTGEERLSGFGAGWRSRAIGDVAQFLRTANNSRADLGSGGNVGYVHYGDIHTRTAAFLDGDDPNLPTIAPAQVLGVPRLQNGDLIMVDASEDYEGVGKSVEVRNPSGRPVVAGLHTLLMRPDPRLLARGFGGYLQFIPAVRSALQRAATGISVYGVSKASVRAIEVRLPPVDEQRAIAAVLSDMDAELAALEQRLAKTRALKQAMMQELLTGRTRLTPATSK